ncbi:MAG TPA: hypothetical protein PK391_07245 [Syntrophales bacterium]|nr:hypothetical protein [Syntrophales bacterium]
MNGRWLTTIEIMIILAILAGLGIGGWIGSQDQPVVINPPAQAEKAK